MSVAIGAVTVTGLAALALPGEARAHGGGFGSVASGYRFQPDPQTESLAGVRVKVLEPRRTLELRPDPGVEVVVGGRRGEPFARVDDRGTWINAASVTAQEGRLVPAVPDGSSGWVRTGSGHTLVLHDDVRLRPASDGAAGAAGRVSIPLTVNGETAAISGVFVPVPRPATALWLAAGAALAAGLAAVAARRRWRGTLTVALGGLAGAAALGAMASFALHGSATGGLSAFPLVASLAAGAVLGSLLIVLRGNARLGVAGLTGAVAVGVCAGFLPVFWQGLVVSAAPAGLTRLLVGVALVCGAAAAALGFLTVVEDGGVEPASEGAR